MTRSALPGLAIAVLVLIAGLLLAFTVGRYPVSLGDLVTVLTAKLTGHAPQVPAAVQSVILQVRGPRVLAACMVGAALAVAGTAFQGLFRNPLVSPDILGASSGAALGAVLGIYFSLGIIVIQVFAFAGGLVGGHRRLPHRHAGAFARPDPGAGADRRGGRRAAWRRRRPRQISRRSVQPASRHDLLAARQPVGGERRRSVAAVRPGRDRHRRADRAALAHERHVAAGGGSARARVCPPGRCASPSLRRQRW